MKDALWLAEDAASATGGELTGADSWIASGISIDTRSLEKGDLFVALKDVRDGHDFLNAAYAAGASAALVSDGAKAKGPALVVSDVFEALRNMADASRERGVAKRIAITGSVGKTSTKEALASCLAASGPTHRSIKSYNNHWGVPLTLARMPRDVAYAVFEIGMNHRGEILPLTTLVKPHIAIVTSIAPAHVENLGSIEAVADEKGDVYAGLEPEGVALVPNEAQQAGRLLAAAEQHAATVVRFGRDAVCEARLLKFDMVEGGAVAEADILGRQIRYRIGAEGAHWALNSVASLAAADLAGADLFAAAHALADLKAIDGRGVARSINAPFGAFVLIDDAYNANPVSMGAALATLGARNVSGRRIVALGDMLELGPQESAYHAGLAEPIGAANVDLVFASGPRMKALWDALPASRRGGYAEDSATLAPMVLDALRAGDCVLVKGSNGSRMIKVVDALARLGGA